MSLYIQPLRLTGGVKLQLYSFFYLVLDGVGGQRHAPGRFTPGEDPVPFVQEAGWDPGPVWTGAENLAPTGIRYRTVQGIGE